MSELNSSKDSNKTLSRLQQAFKNQEEAMRKNPQFGLPPAPPSYNHSINQPSALSMTAPKSQSNNSTDNNSTVDPNFTFDFNILNSLESLPLDSFNFSTTLESSSSTQQSFQRSSIDEVTNQNDQSASTSYSTSQQNHSTPHQYQPKSNNNNQKNNNVVHDILSNDLFSPPSRQSSLTPTSPPLNSPPLPSENQNDSNIEQSSKNDPIASQVWKMYAKQKASLPNGQRMENLTWRMMALSLRKKREAENLAVSSSAKPKNEERVDPYNDKKDVKDESKDKAEQPTESIDKSVDEDEERGRKPRRKPVKPTKTVVGFAGKVPEGLDNGEHIVDELMDWRGKSRSRSRSVMDWRGQSRSRSRPAYPRHFVPTLPAHAPSPDTPTDGGSSGVNDHIPHVKHELGPTIEENQELDQVSSNVINEQDKHQHYNYDKNQQRTLAISLPDPHTFLQYNDQIGNNNNNSNNNNNNILRESITSDHQSFFNIINDGKSYVNNNSASLLSKSLSSTYNPPSRDHVSTLSSAAINKKRPAEYSPKFTTLFNHTNINEPPPFSLSNSYLPYQNTITNTTANGAEGSFGPPSIDVNEQFSIPNGFPDDGGLSALLSQSAPGAFSGAFPPTMPQSLTSYHEYNNNETDFNSIINMIYGNNTNDGYSSSPTTPSINTNINPLSALNPGYLVNNSREVRPLPNSQGSSRYSSNSPNLPNTIKKSPVQSKKPTNNVDSGVKKTSTAIPIAKKPSQSHQQIKSPKSPTNITTDTAGNQMMCNNCKTVNTPLWRRDPEGNPLCNACGLFLKLHGVVRPLSLKSDVIKKRNRSGPGSNSSNKNNTGTNNSNNSQTPITSSNITKSKPNQFNQATHHIPIAPALNNKNNNGNIKVTDEIDSPSLLPFLTFNNTPSQITPQAIVNTKKRRTSNVQKQHQQQLQQQQIQREKQIESSIGYLSIEQTGTSSANEETSSPNSQ